jgi:voltage-gated potassium channel
MRANSISSFPAAPALASAWYGFRARRRARALESDVSPRRKQLPERTPTREPPPALAAAPTAPATSRDRQERVTWIDWVMLALAVLTLSLLIAEQTFSGFFQEHPDLRRWLIIADTSVCGVFLVEFLARMRRASDRWGYVKSRWYEVLGMIPISHPFFRAFRFLRILRILVISSRFVRATNRTFGEMAFEATVGRFRDNLVDLIGDAITLRSLSVIEPPLVRSRFADRVGDAMEARRPEIRALVRDAMNRVPGGRGLMRMGIFQKMVAAAETAAVDAVIETLQSDELNQIVQEATRNILDEMRAKIEEREAERLEDTGRA